MQNDQLMKKTVIEKEIEVGRGPEAEVVIGLEVVVETEVGTEIGTGIEIGTDLGTKTETGTGKSLVALQTKRLKDKKPKNVKTKQLLKSIN